MAQCTCVSFQLVKFIFKGRFLKKKSRCARRKEEGGESLYSEGADFRVPKKEAVIPQ
jgi:hypothetical protein